MHYNVPMAIKTESGDLKPIIYLGAIGPEGLLIVRYKTPPNPCKQGWWIPAPEIGYGEDPSDEVAALAKDLGLQVRHQELAGVDSFMANDAWHLVFKYRVEVTGDVSHENIEEARWVTTASLPSANEFAHGNWEVDLCRFFLSETEQPIRS
jgi:ADP-ribose pyrophosphatase YjhB (NUDIX family)